MAEIGNSFSTLQRPAHPMERRSWGSAKSFSIAEASFGGGFFVHFGAGGEVEDDVGGEGLEGGGEGGGVDEVGGLPVGLVGGFLGRVGGEAENFVAACEEAVDDMGADEAGAAGDEGFHSCLGEVGGEADGQCRFR